MQRNEALMLRPQTPYEWWMAVMALATLALVAWTAFPKLWP